MKKPIVVIKYGGNAMTSTDLQKQVVEKVKSLMNRGLYVILVHGGGPFIKRTLKMADVESEFIDGHRKTTTEALKYIEMTLKGEVNSQLVNLLSKQGIKAVGLSGKDGNLVTAEKRELYVNEGGKKAKQDLGRVGNVKSVNPELITILLKNDFLPVITCIASDEEGRDYNINADIFAGNLAGAMEADHFLLLTDVDGLMRDQHDPESLIKKISVKDIQPLLGEVITGGMRPKVESCQIALEKGAKSAKIINGTKPEQLTDAVFIEPTFKGTEICLQ